MIIAIASRANPVAPPSAVRSRARGFSLVELLVATAIGLVVMGAVTVGFVGSSNARRSADQASQQVESGRYAMQLLSEELQLAGYYAEFDPFPMATPAAKPDPCATDLPTLRTAMAMHVQAYDNITATTAATLTCLSDVKTGTDVLVIRRVSTCVAGSSGCDAFVAGTPYFQASLCSSASELDSASFVDYFAMDNAAAGLTKHKKDCLTAADYHRFLTRIYFVANNDVAGDGIPTLKRAELVGTSFITVPLVEGVENLQAEWGLDTSATPDGAPDVFNANPDTYTGAGAVGATGNWRNVVSARVNVLARNTQSTAGYNDTKTYTLGHNADGSANSYTPSGAAAAYRRHLYVAEVRLNNAAQRGVTP